MPSLCTNKNKYLFIQTREKERENTGKDRSNEEEKFFPTLFHLGILGERKWLREKFDLDEQKEEEGLAIVDIFSRPLDSIGRQLTRLGMRAKLDSFFLSMETSWAGSPLTPRPHLDNSTWKRTEVGRRSVRTPGSFIPAGLELIYH